MTHDGHDELLFCTARFLAVYKPDCKTRGRWNLLGQFSSLRCNIIGGSNFAPYGGRGPSRSENIPNSEARTKNRSTYARFALWPSKMRGISAN